MKLIRYGEKGKEKPGVMIHNVWHGTSVFGEDYDEKFFETDGLKRLGKFVEQYQNNLLVISQDIRLGPPLVRPSKIICVGLNYAKHAQESGAKIPAEPVLFFKSTTALTGPNDNIIIPKNSQKTDWEVELAVVIGKRASYITETDAMEYIAGYVLHNDISEREFQLERSGQWVKGKSADSFAPMGPFFATKDEVPDPGSLHLWLKVNGIMMQDSNTSDMIFKVPFLVSYISQFMTLLPGDVISTGTPSGVGLGLKPPRYLKAGDVVELGIDGLGSARQNVIAWRTK